MKIKTIYLVLALCVISIIYMVPPLITSVKQVCSSPEEIKTSQEDIRISGWYTDSRVVVPKATMGIDSNHLVWTKVHAGDSFHIVFSGDNAAGVAMNYSLDTDCEVESHDDEIHIRRIK